MQDAGLGISAGSFFASRLSICEKSPLVIHFTEMQHAKGLDKSIRPFCLGSLSPYFSVQAVRWFAIAGLIVLNNQQQSDPI